MLQDIEDNARSDAIRTARADDVPAIEQLVRDTYTKYVSRMNGVLPGPMRDDYTALVQDGVVYVTEDECGISSLLVLLDQPDHLLLDNIAVRPDRQGTGLGKRLFIFADNEARRRGFEELKLYTAEAMYENIALYTRSGWVEYDRFIQKGYPRVFMRRQLGGAA